MGTPAAIMDPEGFTEWSDAMQSVPAAVQAQFQVHGTSRIYGLLTRGIDSARAFHSGPPLGGVYGSDTTRHNNPFLILSQRGRSIPQDGARNIVLNGPAAALKVALQQQFPKVRFMTTQEAVDFMRSHSTIERVKRTWNRLWPKR